MYSLATDFLSLGVQLGYKSGTQSDISNLVIIQILKERMIEVNLRTLLEKADVNKVKCRNFMAPDSGYLCCRKS